MSVEDIKNIFDKYYKSITDSLIISDTYCGLVKGDIGLILCYCYFYRLFGEEQYLNNAQKMMSRVFAQSYNDYSLGYGLAGLAWTVELLKQSNMFECNWDWCEKTDVLLAKECQEQILKGNFDYFSGGMGILNYFLCKQVKGDIVFELAYLYIAEISKRILCKTEKMNLGVPHGLQGSMLLLIKLKLLLQIQDDSLVNVIVNMLWESRNPVESVSILPYFRDIKEDTTLAWCYGDLPFLYCLIKMKVCNISFDSPKDLDSILERTLKRKDCFQNNNTLCHGNIVVALFYYQMWKMTGTEEYLRISNYWKMRSYEVWNESFLNFQKANEQIDYYWDCSLFNGPSGFFLSMLSMENVNVINWEQCLIF